MKNFNASIFLMFFLMLSFLPISQAASANVSTKETTFSTEKKPNRLERWALKCMEKSVGDTRLKRKERNGSYGRLSFWSLMLYGVSVSGFVLAGETAAIIGVSYLFLPIVVIAFLVSWWLEEDNQFARIMTAIFRTLLLIMLKILSLL